MCCSDWIFYIVIPLLLGLILIKQIIDGVRRKEGVKFIILQLLNNKDLEGRNLRLVLRKFGHYLGRASFYQTMAEMTDENLVSAVRKRDEIDGEEYYKVWYSITEQGEHKCQELSSL